MPSARPPKKVKVPRTKGKQPGRRKLSGRVLTPEGQLYRIMPYILLVAALFCAICLVLYHLRADTGGGLVGQALVNVCTGLFAGGVYAIPVLLALQALSFRRDVRNRSVRARVVYSTLTLILVAAVLETFSGSLPALTFDLPAFYAGGQALSGGGVFGGSVAYLLYHLFDMIGLVLIVTLGFFLYIITFIDFAGLRLRRAERRAARQAGPPTEAVPPTEPLQPTLVDASPPQLSRAQRRLLRRNEQALRQGYFEAGEEESFAAIRASMERELGAEPSTQTPSAALLNRHRARKFDPNITIEESPLRPAAGNARPAPPPRASYIPAGTPVARTAQVPPSAYYITSNTPPAGSAAREYPPAGQPPAGQPSAAQAFAEPQPAQQTAFDRSAAAPATDTPPVPPPAPASAPHTPQTGGAFSGTPTAPASSTAPLRAAARTAEPPAPSGGAVYHFPPLALLRPGTTAIMDTAVQEEIERNSEKLVQTLDSFKVGTHIVGTSRGPRVTRYELMPNPGVRISSIVSRIDDISLNLASGGIRIEAPIPGMSAVGVEVPNRHSAIVRLRDMLSSHEFVTAPAKTTVCVGSDVTGNPVYADVAKMPHLLIAGATGMGKSVCMNAIIMSILYKARPDEVKLMMIDPKRVELNIYNGIPHLLVPVVTEPQNAAGALIWAVGEMERRFTLIESVGVRDISGYNKAVSARPSLGEALPKIVIIIDELNDLMMNARDAVEDAICRIAQKARAAGIHLIVGTQRPSVDVITGLIKANIPTRISFRVSSQVDSRTILDMAGAEKLLDKGDMLFNLVGLSEPKRVQGAFVEEDEVEKVTSYLKRNAAGDLYDDAAVEGIRMETDRYKISTIKPSDRPEDEDFNGQDMLDDEKFRQAIELALEFGKISTSLIQRKLSIGYGRAAKYIDAMEEMRVVSPPDGQKPRDVLITRDMYLEMLSRE
ncbi:MAG: DNA translocase FtsK [Eubacteriales bacterium]